MNIYIYTHISCTNTHTHCAYKFPAYLGHNRTGPGQVWSKWVRWSGRFQDLAPSVYIDMVLTAKTKIWIEKTIRKTCFDISKVSQKPWGPTTSNVSRRGTLGKSSNTNNGCIMDNKDQGGRTFKGSDWHLLPRNTPTCSFFVCPSC